MSVFKKQKPKRNFRSKRRDSDSEDEKYFDDFHKPQRDTIPFIGVGDTHDKKGAKKEKNLSNVTSSTAVGSVAAVTGTSASSVLSFQNDEEEEVFQIKKSNHSKRIVKQLKKERKQEREDEEKAEREAAHKTTRPDYSAESMKKLKDEQNSQNGIAPIDMEMGSDVECAPSPVVKSEESQDVTSVDTEDNHSSHSSSEEESMGPSFKEMLASGHIPDAATIHLARKKRQMARELGDEGFIPLDDTVKAEKNASRLVREDENDRSDEDGPIAFSVTSREQQLRNMEHAIIQAEDGNSEDSDQERQWELMQIRKGVQAISKTTEKNTAATRQPHESSNSPNLHRTASSNGDLTKLAMKMVVAPPKGLPQIKIDDVRKRLKERLDEMCTVHRVNLHERDDLSSRMSLGSTDITDHTSATDSLQDRYQFYQEMRGYVTDLVECLNEKVPSINYMERRMMKLWKSRAERLIKRRQDDIKDQAQDFMSNRAASAVSGMESTEELEKQRRTAERQARRGRRKRKRQAFDVNAKDHHDGVSSDDEENQAEILKFNTDRDFVKKDAGSMFEDVTDEFWNLDLIKTHFEDWKRQYSDSYNEAYIGLCLPKLFASFVQSKLLFWNPLEQGHEVEKADWYSSLMFYNYRAGDAALFDDDSDMKLVPSVVERMVLPRLTELVEVIWDPISSSQTQRLVELILRLIRDYPTITMESKYTQGLMKALVQRIRKTLDDDVFMPMYPKQILENKLGPAAIFFNRQFWSCVKLFGNLCLWQGILADTVLQELALNSLLNRYLVLALHNSPVNPDSLTKCHAITKCVPKVWFVSRQEDSTTPHLEPLCRYLVYAAHTIDKEPAIVPSSRECIRQIRKMLVLIHAVDHASNLSEQLTSFKS